MIIPIWLNFWWRWGRGGVSWYEIMLSFALSPQVLTIWAGWDGIAKGPIGMFPTGGTGLVNRDCLGDSRHIGLLDWRSTCSYCISLFLWDSAFLSAMFRFVAVEIKSLLILIHFFFPKSILFSSKLFKSLGFSGIGINVYWISLWLFIIPSPLGLSLVMGIVPLLFQFVFMEPIVELGSGSD